MIALLRGTRLEGDTSAERHAYQWILEEICSGRLAGGTRLKSEMLATAIGVSRIPVREAIRRLESEGFITVRRNRGAIVTPHGPEEIREIFEIRSVLEGLAVRLGTHRFDRDALLDLKNLLTRLKRARPDSDLWITRHTEFHLFLCSRCGRTRLISEITKFNNLCEPYMRLWYSQRDPRHKETDEHQEIISALETGDPAQVEAVMREHIGRGAVALTEFFQPANQEEPERTPDTQRSARRKRSA